MSKTSASTCDRVEDLMQMPNEHDAWVRGDILAQAKKTIEDFRNGADLRPESWARRAYTFARALIDIDAARKQENPDAE